MKFRACDRESGPCSEMADAVDVGEKRRLHAACRFEVRHDLIEIFARQPVKHGEMSPKKISVRREMLPAQGVERFEIAWRNPCCDDEWYARFQLPRPSPVPFWHFYRGKRPMTMIRMS